MGQNIINIPVVWDDDLFTKVIERGVIEEVRKEITNKALDKLGLDKYYGPSELFEDTVKECIRELFDERKDEIIEEIVSRGHKSLINSKAFKEAKKDMEAWMNE